MEQDTAAKPESKRQPDNTPVPQTENASMFSVGNNQSGLIGGDNLTSRQRHILAVQRTLGNRAAIQAVSMLRRDAAGANPAPDPVRWQDATLGQKINDATQSVSDIATFIAKIAESGALVSANYDANLLQEAEKTYLNSFQTTQNPLDQTRATRCHDVLQAIGLPGPANDPFTWADSILGRGIQIGLATAQMNADLVLRKAAADQAAATKDLENARLFYKANSKGQINLASVMITQVLDLLYAHVAQQQAPGLQAPEAGWTKANPAPAALSAGTTVLTADQAKQARDALVPPTPDAVKFSEEFNGQHYGARIKTALEDFITRATAGLVTNKGPDEHKDDTKVFSTDQYVSIAQAAKEIAVDPVFGSFAVSKAFSWGTNLKDQFEETEKEQSKMTDKQKQTVASDLLWYVLQANSSIRVINKEHNAIPEHAEEKAILTPIVTDLKNARTQELCDIERGWEGEQNSTTHVITLQRFRSTDPDKDKRETQDRRLLWENFQTMIHEYCHALVHPGYSQYADSFGSSSRQYNTLMEGMDSVLADIAWSTVASKVMDPALRTKVEGPAFAQKPFDPATVPPGPRRYASFTEAMKVVNIAGIQNVYAAYFLGKTKLIGDTITRSSS